ncbi:MAG: arginyltransferase [Hyphomicrobiales bacterium]|nr:arginyltransferase [Hyphomicrobiales bacterium]
MTEQKKRFPEFYVTAPQPCPYVPGRLERKIFTHLTPEKPRPVVDNLLKNGFRRSQNIAYMPYCDKCSACVSVRIVVAEFEPKRTLKRIWRRNCDLHAFRVASVPTSEQYSLFRAYIDSRHGDGGMADMSVFDYSMMVADSAVETFITEYRQRPIFSHDEANRTEWPLVAAALCDKLSDGISLVYSYYEPEFDDRSLGSYIIMEHVALAQKLGLPFVYLGYWIEGSRKMAYKSRFLPQQRLTPKGWVRVEG